MTLYRKMRIAIADDHPVVLQGLSMSLLRHAEFSIETTFSDPQDLLSNINGLSCDILILDLNMGMDAERMIEEILINRSDISIIAFTSYAMPSLVKTVMEKGVRAYILKHSPESEMLKAIDLVAAGHTYTDSNLQLMETQSSHELEDDFTKTQKITPREQEILALITEGLTSKEIATKLFLSHSTIESHKKNIMKKIGAKNIADMIRFGIENNI